VAWRLARRGALARQHWRGAAKGKRQWQTGKKSSSNVVAWRRVKDGGMAMASAGKRRRQAAAIISQERNKEIAPAAWQQLARSAPSLATGGS